MTADMNSILVGYQGAQDMLSAIYGKPKHQAEEEAEAVTVDLEQQPGSLSTKPQHISSSSQKPAPVTLAPVIVELPETLPPLTASAFDRMFAGNSKGLQ